jgi:hypothetical protein
MVESINPGDDGQPENGQPEIFGRTEGQCDGGQRNRQADQDENAEHPADRAGYQGYAQSQPAFALLVKFVAVQYGSGRSRRSGSPDQDGRNGAAVHGPDIDAGKHHKSDGWVHAERKGKQQGHGDGPGYSGKGAAQNSPEDSKKKKEQA